MKTTTRQLLERRPAQGPPRGSSLAFSDGQFPLRNVDSVLRKRHDLLRPAALPNHHAPEVVQIRVALRRLEVDHFFRLGQYMNPYSFRGACPDFR